MNWVNRLPETIQRHRYATYDGPGAEACFPVQYAKDVVAFMSNSDLPCLGGDESDLRGLEDPAGSQKLVCAEGGRRDS